MSEAINLNQLPVKKMMPSIRKFIKEFEGKIDCQLDENQMLVDPTAKLMYEAYLVGRRELSPRQQCYIIGSVTEQGLQFALSPVVHQDKDFATAESGRLRKRHGKPFFLFSGSMIAMELLKEVGDNKKAKTRVYQGPPTSGPTLSPRIRKELKLLTAAMEEHNGLGETCRSFGIVIRGMDHAVREAYFDSLCAVFGESTRDLLTQFRPTSVMIEEVSFVDRQSRYIDGYRVADRYSLVFITDAASTSETVKHVQDYKIPAINAETELLTDDRLKALITLRRVFHTHLTCMLNSYNGTQLDARLPTEDPELCDCALRNL
jgi:hypothetical protein